MREIVKLKTNVQSFGHVTWPSVVSNKNDKQQKEKSKNFLLKSFASTSSIWVLIVEFKENTFAAIWRWRT